MKTITLEQLRELGACENQLEKFKQLFGESVTLSPELVKYAEDFDWNWAADHLLADTARAEYWRITDEATARGERVVDPAWAEYKRLTAPAYAEYERSTAVTRVEYERAIAPALAEFDRATNAALAEYAHVAAKTFLRLAMEEN